jgi:hypothetical protein
MERRFGGLRAVSVIFKILAAVALLISVGGLVVAVIAPTLLRGFWGAPGVRAGAEPWAPAVPGLMFAPVLVGLSVFFGGLVYALFLFAAGQGIDLLLALEENTREAAHFLRRLPPRVAAIERQPAAEELGGGGAEGPGGGGTEPATG